MPDTLEHYEITPNGGLAVRPFEQKPVEPFVTDNMVEAGRSRCLILSPDTLREIYVAMWAKRPVDTPR